MHANPHNKGRRAAKTCVPTRSVRTRSWRGGTLVVFPRRHLRRSRLGLGFLFLSRRVAAEGFLDDDFVGEDDLHAAGPFATHVEVPLRRDFVAGGDEVERGAADDDLRLLLHLERELADAAGVDL